MNAEIGNQKLSFSLHESEPTSMMRSPKLEIVKLTPFSVSEIWNSETEETELSFEAKTRFQKHSLYPYNLSDFRFRLPVSVSGGETRSVKSEIETEI